MGDKARADRVILLLALLLTGVGLVLVYSTSMPLALGRAGADRRVLPEALPRLRRHRVPPAPSAPRGCPAKSSGAWPTRLVAFVTVLLHPPVGAAPGPVHQRGAPLGEARRASASSPPRSRSSPWWSFLAHSLAKRGDRVRSFGYGYLPHVVLPAIPIGLVLLEPDLGTAALLAAVVLATCFAGGVRVRHLGVGLLPLVPLAVYLLWFVAFRRDRILAFLDPWEHSQGAGFQLVQSLLAFGAGGLWGVGLGAGRQKLYYLPEAHTDFILSVWAEERGLVGVLVVLLLSPCSSGRGYAIALRQEDPFRRLLATGITTWIGLQAALNALVVTGCLPTKGLPFPFLSYGGTGLVVTLTAAGLLAGLAQGVAST